MTLTRHPSSTCGRTHPSTIMAVLRWAPTPTTIRWKEVACVFDLMVPEQEFDFRKKAVDCANMVAQRE